MGERKTRLSLFTTKYVVRSRILLARKCGRVSREPSVQVVYLIKAPDWLKPLNSPIKST